LLRFLLVEASQAAHVQPRLATSVSAPDDAPGKKNCQSAMARKTCRSVVLDVRNGWDYSQLVEFGSNAESS